MKSSLGVIEPTDFRFHWQRYEEQLIQNGINIYEKLSLSDDNESIEIDRER